LPLLPAATGWSGRGLPRPSGFQDIPGGGSLLPMVGLRTPTFAEMVSRPRALKLADI
jgi:hypothetical protein